MTSFARYAIYTAPPAGSSLERFAAAWLGRDLDAQPCPRLATRPPIAEADWMQMTAEPRRYGFHATLKAPFRLVETVGPGELAAGVDRLARALAPVAAGPLELTEIGPFLALCPAGDASAINDLAGRAVTALEPFRAPLSSDEIAHRRPDRLTARQRGHLERWGYPFVFDDFRFHMTLTGPLADADRALARAALEPLVAPFAKAPLAIDEICIFGQPGPDALFRLLSRHRLSGATANPREAERSSPAAR